MTFPHDDRAWIQTFTGIPFNLLDPQPEMIDIHDLAHHLACLNRFTGALVTPMSVAQHAVLASFLVPREFALEALHHDDHEAYVNDLNGPLKRTLKNLGDAHYEMISESIQLQVELKFNLSTTAKDAVKRADRLAVRMEADAGFSKAPTWAQDYPALTTEEKDRVPLWILTPRGWREAEHIYLSRHDELMQERRRD